MGRRRHMQVWKGVFLTVSLAAWTAFPACANEKPGMPDLCQQEQTCLPTSTANLIVWFGTHGYPKLIVDGDSKDDGYIHTVHKIMTATDARYDWGTRTDAIKYGIRKYVHDAGYDCDVEYRGLDWSKVKMPEIVKDEEGEKYKADMTTPQPFTSDWLQNNNDDPNKGFILLLAYCKYSRVSNTFTSAINAGHAVTLVNAEPNMILIHDPAHDEDEPGRKILTPTLLTGGTFELPGYNAPLAGLMLLDGTLLEAPYDSQVLLTGAVCISMHPVLAPMPLASTGASSGSAGVVGADPSTHSTPGAPVTPGKGAPTSDTTNWVAWLFDLFFKN